MGNSLDLDELNILKITFRNGLEKILQENLVGNLAGKSCRKSCRKSCGKILREILAGNGGGEKSISERQCFFGNLAFGIG